MDHVQVAGGIVTDGAGSMVLVAKEDQRAGHDLWWSYPKGHIELGESREAAAKREVYEETGIQELSLLEYLGVYQRPTYVGKSDAPENVSKEIHVFHFRAKHVPLSPPDPIHPEARWCTFSEAIALISHPADRAFIRSIVQKVE